MPFRLLLFAATAVATRTAKPHPTPGVGQTRPPAAPSIPSDTLWVSVWPWLIVGLVAALIIAGFIVVVFWMYRHTAAQPSPNDKNLEGLRIVYGFWLIVSGLMVTLAVAILTLSLLRVGPNGATVADDVAVITAITGVIGTLIAAFFGIQAAGAGRSQALSALAQIQSQATASDSGYQIDPTYGPRQGNTLVSISGNGLANANAVNFGTISGRNFQVVNDGLLRVTSPPAPDGVYDADLTVIFPTAAQQNIKAATFHYYAISATSGPAANPPQITITGSGFAGANAVYFGPVAGTNFALSADNKTITVTPPNGAANTDVNIAVAYPVSSPTNRAVVGTYRYTA